MNPHTATPERLAGYALVREAGRGAMSTVYEARDGEDRRVALKVLHAPPTLPAAQQRALVDRLDREARVMLRLSHPNVVRIFDVGQEAGEHFIVMEFLDGQTLRSRLDGGPLSLVEASRVLDGVAAALDAVHAEGIVHRDVKPSNVMLLSDGQVKLMDFGIARQGDDTTITQTGMIVGSPAYMSPEQVRGEENTHSTDLWALGILLYEMLAGHSPFTGSNVSTVLYRVAHEAPAPLPGVSNTVQQILRRALDKNPIKRPHTGRELADAFRAAVLGPSARPPALARPRPRWPLVALPVAAMLALLVGTVFFTRSHPRSGLAVNPPPSATDPVRTRLDASRQHSSVPRQPGSSVPRQPNAGRVAKGAKFTGRAAHPRGHQRLALAPSLPGSPGRGVPGKPTLAVNQPGLDGAATIQEVTPTPNPAQGPVPPPRGARTSVVPGTATLPHQGPGAPAVKPRAGGGKPKAGSGKPARRVQAKRRTPAPNSVPRRSRPPRTAYRQRAAARQRNIARRRGRSTRRIIYVRRSYPTPNQRLQSLHRFIYHDFNY